MHGSVVEFRDWKLNQKWNENFNDPNSQEYQAKATEIESILFSTICKRLGCTSIVIQSMKKGSILVTFSAIFKDNNTVSMQDVNNVMKQVIDDPKIAQLNPDKTTLPQAQGKLIVLHLV